MSTTAKIWISKLEFQIRTRLSTAPKFMTLACSQRGHSYIENLAHLFSFAYQWETVCGIEGLTELFIVAQQTIQPSWKTFRSEDLLQLHNEQHMRGQAI